MRELTREQVEYAVGRLVRLVESRGITQTQLEQASGVNQSTISKIFSGWQEPGADKYTPSEETLTKLFAAIGLKLSDILNESDRFADQLVGYMATPLSDIAAHDSSDSPITGRTRHGETSRNRSAKNSHAATAVGVCTA